MSGYVGQAPRTHNHKHGWGGKPQTPQTIFIFTLLPKASHNHHSEYINIAHYLSKVHTCTHLHSLSHMDPPMNLEVSERCWCEVNIQKVLVPSQSQR